MSNINGYINFVHHLAERLEFEIDLHVDCGCMEDPNDEAEKVPVELGIGNWRQAIGNLKTIAGFLEALASLEPSE
ncbi:MAG: hypothetical protein CVT74_02300 [Alphaproteobacteria bacterium HGW-Alphaproteobacteria-13]|jgi:hypothetical protein|nr:MAG: hypothetical protein CVT74_02300 [Alphaproteobacteria bacterium HGW-Alphaproteobacteria-13]